MDAILAKLTKAESNKNKAYAASTTGQQVLATTNSSKSYVYQNKLLSAETKNLKQQNQVRQKALKQTRDSYIKAQNKYDIAKTDKEKSQKNLLNNKTVMSNLNSAQKKALEAGKTVSTKGISDPKVLKKVEEYNKKVKTATDLSKKLKIEQEALDKANQEASASQAEYAQAVIDNEKKKLENISNFYDSHMSQYENRNSLLNTYMDRVQSQGYNLSAEYYTAQIGQYEKQVAEKQAELAAMRKQFQNAVSNGTIKEGTEEYYEMQDSIDQVAMSIEETTNNIVDMQSAIRDLEWSQFDQLQDAIGRITSESDFLIDLMSHKDMYDKDGKITEQGLATMGLHGVNYNTYMAQADKYKEEMLKISEELANDPNNQKLIDRKNELIDAQQQAILSAENEKDSIKDLIQDGIDKELDALNDLIDKYLDSLEASKSLYDYQKKISEQSENIASLQKQLSVLQGDNSEENKAKLQKLKDSLKSAQSDLEDSQYDRYVSDQKELLNNLKDEFKTALDERMDNVDALLSDTIATINSNSSNIRDTLETETKNVGITLSDEMKTIWTQENSVITGYGDKFYGEITGVNSAIGKIYDRQKEMITALSEMAIKFANTINEALKTPTVSNLEEVKDDTPQNMESSSEPETPQPNTGVEDAVLVTPNKKTSNTTTVKTGNGKAEVGDKVTFASGKYYAASDGTGKSGSLSLGKKVKITRINKGAKYPYCINSTDGTQLGWVKLSQLKGYASGIMKVPEDQLAWTQEQGNEAIIRNDGGILTPLSRDMSVLNADMTKNLWDFMSNPGSFINDFSDGFATGDKYVTKSETTEIHIDKVFDHVTYELPNVLNSKDFVKELVNNKDAEKAIRAMTTGRAMGGSSLAKYKYR